MSGYRKLVTQLEKHSRIDYRSALHKPQAINLKWICQSSCCQK